MKHFEVVHARGYKFFFKFDKEFPDMLHIYVRHIKQPKDALRIFFEGKPSWNALRNRFETLTNKEGLYWNWLNEASRKVIIISCFNQHEKKEISPQRNYLRWDG